MTATLRSARPADLDAVTAVFLACWHARYAGLLPDTTVAAMHDARARALWTDVLGGSDAEQAVLVAELAGQVVGVTRCGLDPVTDGAPSGTVHSLYVDPAQQGAGLGGTLLRAATTHLHEAGAQAAHLWVFTANTESVAFYQRRGWRADGATRSQEQFGVPEHRMRLPLTGPDPS